jgi:hypothetical protein
MRRLASGVSSVSVDGSRRADEDLAAVGCDQAAQHRHGRRLAGAVRPEQADDLAGSDASDRSATTGGCRTICQDLGLRASRSPPERARL